MKIFKVISTRVNNSGLWSVLERLALGGRSMHPKVLGVLGNFPEKVADQPRPLIVDMEAESGAVRRHLTALGITPDPYIVPVAAATGPSAPLAPLILM